MDKEPKENKSREAWIMSETKDTYIHIWQNFLEREENWGVSLKGLTDPFVAKVKYVTSLNAFYGAIQGLFNPYLKKKVSSEEYDDLLDKYDRLLLEGDSYSTEDLNKLGKLCNKWFTTEGHGAISNEVQVQNNLRTELEED